MSKPRDDYFVKLLQAHNAVREATNRREIEGLIVGFLQEGVVAEAEADVTVEAEDDMALD